MAVYTAPDPRTEIVVCIICSRPVSLAEVTAGSTYADGRQAFACTRHLLDRHLWINTWALFDIRQKEIHRPLVTELQGI